MRLGWLDLQQALALAASHTRAGEIGIVGIDDADQGQEELQHGGLQR
jgi:hypothetical protein